VKSTERRVEYLTPSALEEGGVHALGEGVRRTRRPTLQNSRRAGSAGLAFSAAAL